MIQGGNLISPGDFGLTESVIDEIRARERKQAQLFVNLLLWGCGLLWPILAFLIYVNSVRQTSLVRLLAAALLGLLGAVIGGFPIAIVSAVLSWLSFPRHPQAKALERYEAATVGIRVCEVCLLVRRDDTPKEGVAYCSRCGAWICPDCRGRYTLRAIAALVKGRGSGHRQG
jgi:hypothetical protein